MRQVISIHVGQGGIQVGNACWELFCLQHDIQPDGTKTKQQEPKDKYSSQNTFETFFNLRKSGKYTPRAVFVDLQPTTVDEVRSGRYRQLYEPDQLVSGKQDAGNVYARGYYTIGRQIIDVCLDRIRKATEQCSNFGGFMIYNCVGGGTGSGFASLLYQRLSVDYKKKIRMGMTVFPSTIASNSVVEPYNSVLATHQLIEHMDVGIFFDNEALHNICRKNLQIELPSLLNMNRVIGRVLNSLTRSLRGDGYIHNDLTQFQTNLIPYPRVNFAVCSYSPFVNSGKYNLNLSVAEHSVNCFQAHSFLSGCDPGIGKFMACTIVYGGDIVPKDVSASIGTIKTKRTIQFVDWCPTGFKCDISYKPITTYPFDDNMGKINRQVCVIANTTAIDQSFGRINYQFDLMYSKRAFVHHYLTEGMEEGEFSEARQNLAALEKDYEEIAQQTEDYGCPFDYEQG